MATRNPISFRCSSELRRSASRCSSSSFMARSYRRTRALATKSPNARRSHTGPLMTDGPRGDHPALAGASGWSCFPARSPDSKPPSGKARRAGISVAQAHLPRTQAPAGRHRPRWSMGVASFLMSPRWGSSGVGDRRRLQRCRPYGPGHHRCAPRVRSFAHSRRQPIVMSTVAWPNDELTHSP
jgi:hypothetical protein